MRPLRTLTIKPNLPDPLKAIHKLAYNIRWAWDDQTQELFRRMDRNLWDSLNHNPVAMLGVISQHQLQLLQKDEGFLAHLNRVEREFENYMNSPGWWSKTIRPSNSPLIAYFSAEFGLTECLPIYSGGLGVLAGDHMKSASELDIPLVGVSLLYQQGYFRQRLNADGWQLELYPRNDFHNMPLTQVFLEDETPLVIRIHMGDHDVLTYVWRIQVGRIPIFMLDTNVPDNSPADRQITAQLYGGDHEMRIRQEIVLGIGGVHLLEALDINPKVFHMNEGHSAFLNLERIRRIMVNQNIDYFQARELAAASTVFTTHTPVPAGNDAFEPWLIDKYFKGYWEQLGLNRDTFLNLGRPELFSKDEPFNMTIFALKTSQFRNGVSKLHGEVAREMWNNVWPTLPSKEVPIRGLVNGVHDLSWVSHDMQALYDRYLGPAWKEKPNDPDTWVDITQIPDEELWRTHVRRRERLVGFARKRMRNGLLRRGASMHEVQAADEILDPEAMTIGFARRFATYKRANLILSDLDRLAEILNRPNQKVQIIFAGKAHPKDNPGKEIIRQLVHTARTDRFRNKLVFLEDYDMNVARYLVQGVDIWLNTPLKPMEASGTSGMKAAANGVLNLSTPDGWWAEAYNPQVGFSVGAGEEYDDPIYQDRVESQAIYDLLEKEIIPLFYNRTNDNLPREWINRMKTAISTLAPRFNTNRMVRDYAEWAYIPAVGAYDRLAENNLAQAKKLNDWKLRLLKDFGGVKIISVHDSLNGSAACVGNEVQVEAIVDFGKLDEDDLAVELFYGKLDPLGEFQDGMIRPMAFVGQTDNGAFRFSTEMPCEESGVSGYTVRVMPSQPAQYDTRTSSLIRWA